MNIILRPERNERTPRALAEDLGSPWSTRRWPGYVTGVPNFDNDFFMIYPEGAAVNTVNPEGYARLRQYYQKNKPNQRLALGELGLPIPATGLRHGWWDGLTNRPTRNNGRFVVRPLRHEGGQDYRVTTDPNAFREGVEYIAELFPKEREYRLLYCFGELIMFWQKRQAEGETQDGPWGAEGHSAFLPIDSWETSYLFRNTDARTVIGNTFVARDSHIVAFDVLYSHSLRQYVVLESNVCPALYWSPRSIEKVVERIRNRPAVQASLPLPPRQPVTETAPQPVPPPTPVQRRANTFSIALPPRPIIETYRIDLLGHEHELTAAEIQHIITGLQQVIR